ncbi:MAG: septation protein SepH [Candidatus Nanopelagicales bacterium]
MRELKFDGLSPDGTRLILAGKDGQKWSVVIDERIEAAVRRDRARISQVEIEQAGVLRPREIQARIRAGATSEDVAAASGLPIEHIRRFEGPVLTERAWVAQQAQSTELRRPGGDIELSELVAERLESAGVEPADIEWDAWRRDDGIWVVIATFPIEPNTHVATWSYDSGSRTMTVIDDNARSLSAIDPDVPLNLAAARPLLASVAARESDPSAQSDDSPAIITPFPGWRGQSTRAAADDRAPDAAYEDDESKADAQEHAVDAEPMDAEPMDAEPMDADGIDAGDQDPDETPGAEPGSDEQLGSEEASEGQPDDADADAEVAEQDGSDSSSGPTADAEDVPLFHAEPTAAPPRPGGRKSIPSFDDILFGPGPKSP